MACGLFLIVAAQFFLVTPILEGNDSRHHFEYVRRLVVYHQLPDAAADNPGHAVRQEATQFPLYYLLGAAVSFAVPTSDSDTVVVVTPSGVYHRPFSGFPAGTELAARVVAIVSIMCGLVTVACAALIARWCFPGQPASWALSGVGVAAVAAFDFESAMVSNDPLVSALASITLVLCACWIRDRSTTWARLSALAVALAVLAKFNAIGLVLVYALVLGWVQVRWTDRLRQLCELGVVMCVVDGWWFARNFIVSGDPTGTAVHRSIGFDPLAGVDLERLATAGRGLELIVRTFLFGQEFRQDQSAPLYGLLVGFAAVGLLAGVIVAFRNRDQLIWRLVLVWPAVLLTETLLWLYVSGPSGRYMFPALAPLSVLAVCGWSWVLRTLNLLRLGPVFAVVAVIPATLQPWVMLRPDYAYPRTLQALPPSATPTRATFDESVQLIGYEGPIENVRAGASTSLTLYWQLLRPEPDPLLSFVHFSSNVASYDPKARYEGAVGHNTYPPNFWAPGQIVVDPHQFRLAEDVRPDQRNAIILDVRTGMYALSSDGSKIRKLSSSPPEASDSGVRVGLWKIPGRPPPSPSSPVAVFQQGLVLESVQVSPSPEGRDVDLHWSTPVHPSRDFTVFVHLLSADGQLLAQHDAFPGDGRYPTSVWSAGEHFFDRVHLPATHGYEGDRLAIGLYVLPSVQPVPLSDGKLSFDTAIS